MNTIYVFNYVSLSEVHILYMQYIQINKYMYVNKSTYIQKETYCQLDKEHGNLCKAQLAKNFLQNQQTDIDQWVSYPRVTVLLWVITEYHRTIIIIINILKINVYPACDSSIMDLITPHSKRPAAVVHEKSPQLI